MGYLDFSNAELFALTRLRRQEARALRLATVAPTVYFSGLGVEFKAKVTWAAGAGKRRGHYGPWRRAQWRAGKRACTYCEVQMTQKPDHLTTITVDHKHPLSLGGADAPHNWAVCCWACNNRKGSMTEAEFRALLCREVATPLRLVAAA